jgi:hypothetical protein
MYGQSMVGTTWNWTLKKDPENAVIFYVGGLVSQCTGSEGLANTKPVLADLSRRHPCMFLTQSSRAVAN